MATSRKIRMTWRFSRKFKKRPMLEHMPSQTLASGIRDNYSRGTVADFLKSYIQEGSRLSVVSAFFTIYAYQALKDWLDRIEHMDFLFGEPRFLRSIDPDKTAKKAFIIDASGLKPRWVS